jgi:hypothetical protein
VAPGVSPAHSSSTLVRVFHISRLHANIDLLAVRHHGVMHESKQPSLSFSAELLPFIFSVSNRDTDSQRRRPSASIAGCCAACSGRSLSSAAGLFDRPCPKLISFKQISISADCRASDSETKIPLPGSAPCQLPARLDPTPATP